MGLNRSELPFPNSCTKESNPMVVELQLQLKTLFEKKPLQHLPYESARGDFEVNKWKSDWKDMYQKTLKIVTALKKDGRQEQRQELQTAVFEGKHVVATSLLEQAQQKLGQVVIPVSNLTKKAGVKVVKVEFPCKEDTDRISICSGQSAGETAEDPKNEEV